MQQGVRVVRRPLSGLDLRQGPGAEAGGQPVDLLRTEAVDRPQFEPLLVRRLHGELTKTGLVAGRRVTHEQSRAGNDPFRQRLLGAQRDAALRGVHVVGTPVGPDARRAGGVRPADVQEQPRESQQAQAPE